MLFTGHFFEINKLSDNGVFILCSRVHIKISTENLFLYFSTFHNLTEPSAAGARRGMRSVAMIS